MSDVSSIKEAAMTFLRLCAAGEVEEAYRDYVGTGFRHHNPHFRGDAESLKSAMREAAVMYPAKTFEIQRALADGTLVAVHSRVRMDAEDPGWSVVHILRFEGGRIMEMWDVGQDQPPDSVNEHGMF